MPDFPQTKISQPACIFAAGCLRFIQLNEPGFKNLLEEIFRFHTHIRTCLATLVSLQSRTLIFNWLRHMKSTVSEQASNSKFGNINSPRVRKQSIKKFATQPFQMEERCVIWRALCFKIDFSVVKNFSQSIRLADRICT